MWYYNVGGLNIRSEIEIPEFFAVPQNDQFIDLQINLGVTPEMISDDDVIEGVYNWTGPTKFLQKILLVANYYFEKDQNLLVIQLLANSGEQSSVRVFLLTSIFPVILHYKRILPIRASAVKYKDGIILFCGKNGVGKSTATAYLNQKGYPVFSDELIIIHPDDINSTQVLGTPAWPMLSLWHDTISELDSTNYNTNYPLRPGILKYGQFFHNSFSKSSLPILKIIHIIQNNELEFSNEIIESKLRKIQLVKNYVYWKEVLTGINRRVDHFNLLTQLTNIPINTIFRPYKRTNISSFIQYLEHECLNE